MKTEPKPETVAEVFADWSALKADPPQDYHGYEYRAQDIGTRAARLCRAKTVAAMTREEILQLSTIVSSLRPIPPHSFLTTLSMAHDQCRQTWNVPRSSAETRQKVEVLK